MGQAVTRPQIGDRIRITGQMDDPNPVPVNTEGTVTWVNTWENVLMEQFSVKWDGGISNLMCIGSDPYEIIGRCSEQEASDRPTMA